MKSRRRLAVPFAAVAAAFFAGMLVMWGLLRFGPPAPKQPVGPVSDTAHVVSDTARASAVSDPAHAPGVSDTSRPPAVSDTGRAPAVSDPVPKLNTGRRAAAPVVSDTRGAVATSGDIPHAPLRVPIDGADPATWKGAFTEPRDAGSRPHEAVDILAPRNTPVHAAADGTIAKLFVSKAGGNTIYQFDAAGRLCYYYAHLERYADGLHEGQPVAEGDVIGYVGTSGNAPKNTPHLHFAVFELGPGKHWWEGRALDPYAVFTR